MAKKRSKPRDKPTTTDASPLRNAAFAGLAGLRDALPEGEPEATASPKPDDTANDCATAANHTLNQKVVVQREKKGRSGKTVTRVRGLASSPDDAKRWAKRLKRQLGCGAIVEDDDVVLLGNVLDAAATALTAAGINRVVKGN